MSGSSRTAARTLGAVLLAVLVAVLLWSTQGDGRSPTAGPDSSPTTTQTAQPAGGTDPESGLPLVDLTDLPPEAADTLDLVERGGPFPYDRDGITFENREEILPDRPSGYYREYTVETPGVDHRGARRIVTGAEGEYYWTDDHYASFSRIVT